MTVRKADFFNILPKSWFHFSSAVLWCLWLLCNEMSYPCKHHKCESLVNWVHYFFSFASAGGKLHIFKLVDRTRDKLCYAANISNRIDIKDILIAKICQQCHIKTSLLFLCGCSEYWICVEFIRLFQGKNKQTKRLELLYWSFQNNWLIFLSLIFQMYLHGILKNSVCSLQILPFVPLKYANHFISDRTSYFIWRKRTLKGRRLY